jgi:3-phytase
MSEQEENTRPEETPLEKALSEEDRSEEGGDLSEAKRATAKAETKPMPSSDDAADDPAIWLHPADASQSVVIGTDKQAGLQVSDLAGNEIQFLDAGTLNNVDIRYGFPLGQENVDVVAASDDETRALRIFKLDAATRTLEEVTAGDISPGIVPYGLCMYKSRKSAKFYAYVTSEEGEVEQWELLDDGEGRVDARKVRGPWDAGGAAEGCVADDELGYLYVAEEEGAIWKYGAEPEDGTTDRTKVDTTDGGNVEADIEGLAIAYGPQGTGFLFASSQGDSSFTVYAREGDNAFLKSFTVEDSEAIDGCSNTDGIDVINRDLGPAFSQGLFICQDGENTMPDANQNFKLVPLETILGDAAHGKRLVPVGTAAIVDYCGISHGPLLKSRRSLMPQMTPFHVQPLLASEGKQMLRREIEIPAGARSRFDLAMSASFFPG